MGTQEQIRRNAEEFAKTMRCNCDLDSWEPEKSSGHSWVCRIHKAAVSKFRQANGLGT